MLQVKHRVQARVGSRGCGTRSGSSGNQETIPGLTPCGRVGGVIDLEKLNDALKLPKNTFSHSSLNEWTSIE